MLVVIEGADGVGKTEVARTVANALGADVIQFPNDDGVTGPLIRDYLHGRWWVERKPMTHDAGASALAFQSLMVVNRLEVMPWLRRASFEYPECPKVVCVRYWQSGWVYGQLDGLDPDFLLRIHQEMVEPHINILLDAPAELCIERQKAREDRQAQRYESKLDFTRKVVDLYRELWGNRVVAGEPWVLVDATKPMLDVVTDIIKICAMP
jgi:dTMP kinase